LRTSKYKDKNKSCLAQHFQIRHRRDERFESVTLKVDFHGFIAKFDLAALHHPTTVGGWLHRTLPGAPGAGIPV